MSQDKVYDLLNVGAPVEVVPLLRFFEDLTFLSQFFEAELPQKVMVQSCLLFLIVYGFGDASTTVPNGISYCIGVWKPDASDESLDCWQDFTNMVESLE